MAKTHTIGIIMNGVTGRMGTNQHLIRSILAIRNQGGVDVGDGQVIMPEPVLLGRNPAKLEALSKAHGNLPYSTDMDALLEEDDALLTQVVDGSTVQHSERVERARHLLRTLSDGLVGDA